MKSDYIAFLQSKEHHGADHGPSKLLFQNDKLFDFQKYIVEWSVRKGRCAIFADCGLGKTPMQLSWAENIARHTDKPVLILAPLAVSAQTISEAKKFGIECERSQDGKFTSRIVVTNYERLKYFDHTLFGGVVCDESSILKSFDGSRKAEITEFSKKLPYRLLATATAAPNDYIELGTSSEALGYLGFMDMLNRFFKNEQNNSGLRRHYGEAPKWRFKGHAELHFWRWVTSWGVACRKPSDIGFDDERFKLPKLSEVTHIVEPNKVREGFLLDLPATTLPEQREEQRRTMRERCEMAAKLAKETDDFCVVWCHLNEEGDLLEELIPGSIQVSGKDSDERKEERLVSFAMKKVKVLITKPKIGAWGLNFQHCNRIIYFPSHSYEQYYQAVRRCWRFGQKRQVHVDLIMTPGFKAVMDNLKRKAGQAERMFENLVREMNNSKGIQKENVYTKKEKLPAWL